MAAAPLGQRMMLWIDGVGGYLVCLGDDVSVGRAFGQEPVDVPVMADLSRKHAVFRRQGEGYSLTPLGSVAREGHPLAGPSLLRDGDCLQLGASVEIRFRQPNPLSRTARLEILTPHRPEPAADGVLLMGETCILGRSVQSHIVCPGWSRSAVLVRLGKGLSCHYPGPVRVDGRTFSGRVELSDHSRVCGDDFCFSLEPLR